MMNTTADSTFTIEKHRVELPGKGPKNAVHIFPIGDVHLDSPNHDAKRFTQDLAAVRESLKHHPTKVIFMGDTHDTVSTKERKALQMAGLHESTIDKLDRDAADSCDRLLKRVEFLNGNILGWIEGNHHWVFCTPDPKRGIVRGMTSTQYLAMKSKAPWLGFVSYVRCGINVGTITVPLDIVACHGLGGGKLAGTTISQVDQLRTVFPEADIYLMGHDHKRGALPVVSLRVPASPRLTTGKLQLREHEQWLARTGSYLRGYVAGEGSYIVRNVMRPTSLGSLYFKVHVERPTDTDLVVKIRCEA